MEYVNENIIWEYVDCHTDYATLVSGRCGNPEWDVRPSTRDPFDLPKGSASRSPILGPLSLVRHEDCVGANMRFG